MFGTCFVGVERLLRRRKRKKPVAAIAITPIPTPTPIPAAVPGLMDGEEGEPESVGLEADVEVLADVGVVL